MASKFLYLVFSVYVVTNTTRVNYFFLISPKVAYRFLDLICSVYVVTITIGVNCNLRISCKSGFYTSGPSLFSIWVTLPSLHIIHKIGWFFFLRKLRHKYGNLRNGMTQIKTSILIFSTIE